MIGSNEIEKAVSQLVLAGRDDWLQALEVLCIVEDSTAARFPESIAAAIAVIECALLDGYFEIGDLDPQFRSWDMTTADAVDRLRAQWQGTPRRPMLGELFWLNLTPKGEAFAASFA